MSQLSVVDVAGVVAEVVLGVVAAVAEVVLGVVAAVGLVGLGGADGWPSIPVTQVNTGPVSMLSVSV